MKFSLVIPCYNEAANLPLLLERCKLLLATPQCEVILVDNGSTDNTAEILEQLLPNYPGCHSVRVDGNQGYGYGILMGLNAASGEILGWTHADMQTDPCDALQGVALFGRYGHDIFVKGSRKGRPLSDSVFTFAMSVFETCLMRTWLGDINAQPTLFSRHFFRRWKNPPKDFSLDLYAYSLARYSSLKIFRFPVMFSDRIYGGSHWNINWAAKRKFISRTVRYSLKLKKDIASHAAYLAPPE